MRRVLAAALLASAAASVAAQLPPVSIRTPEEEVADGFVSYLHGLLYKDLEVRTDGETFRREFPEFLPESHSPIYDIELVTRTHEGWLTVGFSVPLRYQVSVDILGLHPVELQGSRVIGLHEIIRPAGDSRFPELPEGLEIPPDTTDVLVLAVATGYLRVDFQKWLDLLAGRLLDDVDVRLIALLRYRGDWYALMGGQNPEGRSMAWAFNMASSKFMISPPRHLTRFARALVESQAVGAGEPFGPGGP